jgi:hypothetical protein
VDVVTAAGGESAMSGLPSSADASTDRFERAPGWPGARSKVARGDNRGGDREREHEVDVDDEQRAE